MPERPIKLILVGGGTGGHVIPLLALAVEAKKKYPQWQIVYLGAKNDKVVGKLSQNIVQTVDNDHYIWSGKWHRYGNKIKVWELLYFWQADFWRNLKGFFLITVSLGQSFYILRKEKPDLLFSKGGYVAFAPCLAAALLKIPIILHDSDAVTGGSHVLVKRFARRQLFGFKSEQRGRGDEVHVGVPVKPIFRQSLTKEDLIKLKAKYKLPEGAKFVLVTGGGGGAQRVNIGVLEVIDQLKLPNNVHFIVISGIATYEEALEGAQSAKRASKIHVYDFVDDMPDLIRGSLGVVSRAGATILSELSLAQKATIIIPNPLLPRAHQMHNARIFQRKGAAWLVNDDGEEVDLRALKTALNELINDSVKRNRFQSKIKLLATPSATKKTLGIVEEVIEEREFEAVKIKDNLQDIKITRKEKPRFLIYQIFKKLILYSVSIAVFLFISFKFFYIRSVEVELEYESPLISQSDISTLSSDLNSIFKSQNIFQRHFVLDMSNILVHLDQKTYIENFNIQRDFSNSQLQIIIKPKDILGRFKTPEGESIVTADGYALTGYDHLLDDQDLLTIIDSMPGRTEQKLVLSPLDLQFLNEIKSYLAAHGEAIDEVYITAQPREIRFKLRDRDFKIIALNTRDALEQIIALVKALRRLTEESIEPQEYIDIRLIDRVIYL